MRRTYLDANLVTSYDLLKLNIVYNIFYKMSNIFVYYIYNYYIIIFLDYSIISGRWNQRTNSTHPKSVLHRPFLCSVIKLYIVCVYPSSKKYGNKKRNISPITAKCSFIQKYISFHINLLIKFQHFNFINIYTIYLFINITTI